MLPSDAEDGPSLAASVMHNLLANVIVSLAISLAIKSGVSRDDTSAVFLLLAVIIVVGVIQGVVRIRGHVGEVLINTIANVIAAAALVFVPPVHHWVAAGSWRLGVVIVAIVIGIPLLVGVIATAFAPD